MSRSRLLLSFVAVAMVAVACSSGQDDRGNGASPAAQSGGSDVSAAPAGDGPDGASAGDSGEPAQGAAALAGDGSVACSPSPISSTERNVVASGIGWIFGEELPDSFPEPLFERNRIVPVLPADGIPAIDQPRCLTVDEVTTLDDDAAVVVVEVHDDARAYPLEILTWHELVNDTIGGVPVTVSYCPLCNSAIAYDRRVGDRILDFGTSGALTQSSMVMYDRQTETIWSHFDGRAIAGELAGTQLEFFSSAVVSWGDFRQRFPDGLVLSRDTGHQRTYGANPYPGYEALDDPFGQFITDDVDPRLEPKVRVVGVEVDGDAVAVLHEVLFDTGVIATEVGGRTITVWNLPGTSSALDGQTVSGGEDVGATGVFIPSVGDQELSFSRVGGGFVDAETGSTWTIFGEAVDGPLAGEELESLPHLATFWFAWGTFFDETRIVES